MTVQTCCPLVIITLVVTLTEPLEHGTASLCFLRAKRIQSHALPRADFQHRQWAHAVHDPYVSSREPHFCINQFVLVKIFSLWGLGYVPTGTRGNQHWKPCAGITSNTSYAMTYFSREDNSIGRASAPARGLPKVSARGAQSVRPFSRASLLHKSIIFLL